MPYLMYLSDDSETRILLSIPKEEDVAEAKESIKQFDLQRICPMSYWIAKCGFNRLALWFNDNFATG